LFTTVRACKLTILDSALFNNIGYFSYSSREEKLVNEFPWKVSSKTSFDFKTYKSAPLTFSKFTLNF